MEVKPGYKQTEVGVIPEEWEVKPLGETVDFLDGRRRPVKDSDRAKMRGDIPYYGASGVVDYVNDFLFDEDLILLGEDGENILSRNCRLAFKISGKTWVNNHAHVLRPKPGMILDYLVEFLESRDYAQYNTGTAQPKLNKLVCSRIPVLRPPPTEQRAIAEALRDVDGMLGGLDRLIAKKRDLKQAAMQQLLTGKTRLPGFHGEWQVKRLDHVAPLQRGFDLPNRERRAGPYPVVYSNGVLNHHADWQVEGPGVVTGRSGTIGSVTFVEGRYWPHNTALWVTSFKGNSPKFVFYLYTRIGFERFATGSGVPTLNRNDVHSFEVPMPPTVEEQTAIADVLSEMDTELAAWEHRLHKTRALKQAMMQDLLTGKTRLVHTEAAHA